MKGPTMHTAVFCSRYLAPLLIFIFGFASQPAVANLSVPAEQGTPSLQEQIQALYPLSDMSTVGGCNIRNPERALVMMQSGVMAFDESYFPRSCPVHFKVGKIKSPGFKCRYTGYYLGNTFGKGDEVYPLDLKVGKDEITMTIGYCSRHANMAYAYETAIVFEFSSSFLSTATAQQVEDKIGELLSKDLTKAAASPASQQQHSDSAPQNAPPKPAPEPQSVEEGMSPEQVVAILGKPDIIAQGGSSKLIYVYNAKKLKIVFVNNKMSDIE
jgi:hypothetical protein